MTGGGAVRLHHVIEGAASGKRPLLLVGSLGSSLAMWDAQVAALRASRPVVRVDLRGHGGSPAPPGPYALADLGFDVLALLDERGLARVDFCGLSLGGMVGMWLASNAPQRVGRLVLLCTSAHMPPADGWRERAAAVRAAGTVAVVADAVVARWLTPGFAQANPALRAKLRAMVAASPPEGYAACCEAIAAMDLRAALPGIVAPTVVVAGAEDPATPPEHAEQIAAAIPGARMEVVSPMAHLGNVEQAETVTRLIAAHLDGGDAEAGERSRGVTVDGPAPDDLG